MRLLNVDCVFKNLFAAFKHRVGNSFKIKSICDEVAHFVSTVNDAKKSIKLFSLLFG